jgi:hypothetical protein
MHEFFRVGKNNKVIQSAKPFNTAYSLHAPRSSVCSRSEEGNREKINSFPQKRLALHFFIALEKRQGWGVIERKE